jgi:DNA-binding winged helix-turn-helix (wHTH) protein
MANLRFGPFELDTRSGELRRGGARVRLRPQPCAVLTYLAERSGTFVSREELHRHVWGDRTFVHFDQGLNSCIKQIRRALGDSRRRPIFLETLPRRGYRFLVATHAEADGREPGTPHVSNQSEEFLTALARAVARELTALLAAGSTGSPEPHIRLVESERLQEAARRALTATFGAAGTAGRDHRSRERAS